MEPVWSAVADTPRPADNARMAIARLSPRLLRAASDERLVALTRAGVDTAFEAIYDRHHRHLLSFCRHMLGSHAEGEDAVQQTFLSAHGALLASERPVPAARWLQHDRPQPLRQPCCARGASGPPTSRSRSRRPVSPRWCSGARTCATCSPTSPRCPRGSGRRSSSPSSARSATREIAGVLGVPRVKVKALVFQARESLLAFRSARDADCREIREQLATLTGGALRRAPLRRHLAVCDGCSAYKAEIARQRTALALLLPVVPSAALKHGVLGGGGAAAGGGLLAAGGKGVAVKLAVTAAVAATAAGGTIVAVEDHAPARADAPAPAVAAHRTAHAAHRAPARSATAVATVRALPLRAPAHPRAHRAAVHPRPRHSPAPAPAASATPRVTSPGRSASTPSRTGATPSHANPTPGVPRGKALGHAKPHPAKPVKVTPVKVHPAKPVKPAAATKPHGQSAAPHGNGQSDH